MIALDPDLERLVTQALNSPHGAALDPGVADTLTRQRRRDRAQAQEDLGVPACLLVPDADPRADGPPAQARRAAAAGAGAQRDSRNPLDPHRLDHRRLAVMNVKRFTARTSRDALALVRQAFGDDAVVLSTRPCAEGVEVLAMAPDGVPQIERVAAEPRPCRAGSAVGRAADAAPSGAPPARAAPTRRAAPEAPPRAVEQDVDAAVDEHAVVPGLCARAHAASAARPSMQAAGARARPMRAQAEARAAELPPRAAPAASSRAAPCRADAGAQRAAAAAPRAAGAARRQPRAAPPRRAEPPRAAPTPSARAAPRRSDSWR